MGKQMREPFDRLVGADELLKMVPPARAIGTVPRPAPSDFERLDLSVVHLQDLGTALVGRIAGRLDIRVRPRTKATNTGDCATTVWDVTGHWLPATLHRPPARDFDEWLGLDILDAVALVRGLVNEAYWAADPTALCCDSFMHRGHRILNPFQDRFGNDTSPQAEYGAAYLAWRNDWRAALEMRASGSAPSLGPTHRSRRPKPPALSPHLVQIQQGGTLWEMCTRRSQSPSERAKAVLSA
jgi:hypothetical protein